MGVRLGLEGEDAPIGLTGQPFDAADQQRRPGLRQLRVGDRLDQRAAQTIELRRRPADARDIGQGRRRRSPGEAPQARRRSPNNLTRATRTLPGATAYRKIIMTDGETVHSSATPLREGEYLKSPTVLVSEHYCGATSERIARPENQRTRTRRSSRGTKVGTLTGLDG